jgi:hypothetical protein
MFKNIDVLEILKLGAIGLGFLLAAMAFILIRREQKRQKPNEGVMRITRIFMTFSLLIMILGIASQLVGNEGILKLSLGKDQLSVKKLTYSSTRKLPDDYFVSSEYRFAVKQPDGRKWSAISSYNGLMETFKFQRITVGDIDFKNDKIDPVAWNTFLDNNPFFKFIDNGKFFMFEKTGSVMNVHTTDSSGNDYINKEMKRYGGLLLTIHDTTIREQRDKYLEELRNYHHELIGLDTIEAKVGGVISVFPKEALPPVLSRLTLSSFCFMYIRETNSNMFTDKLVAVEDEILVGTEIELTNVIIANRTSDFNSKKYMVFTENEKFFYVIEITYSPQVNSSIALWDDLQEYLNSFTLLKD